MSVSPILGAVTAGAFPVPQAAEPVLLALAAGVIVQAAWVGLRVAFHGVGTSRREFSHAVASVAIAAIITGIGREHGRLSLRRIIAGGATGLARLVERLPTEQPGMQRLGRRAG